MVHSKLYFFYNAKQLGLTKMIGSEAILFVTVSDLSDLYFISRLFLSHQSCFPFTVIDVNLPLESLDITNILG